MRSQVCISLSHSSPHWTASENKLSKTPFFHLFVSSLLTFSLVDCTSTRRLSPGYHVVCASSTVISLILTIPLSPLCKAQNQTLISFWSSTDFKLRRTCQDPFSPTFRQFLFWLSVALFFFYRCVAGALCKTIQGQYIWRTWSWATESLALLLIKE